MSLSDKLLLLQTGNFGAAYRQFEAGGEETYHDQRRSVDFIASLAPATKVTVVSLVTDPVEPYDTMLSKNLRAIGVRRHIFHSDRFGRDLLENIKPELFIPRLPHLGAIEGATRAEVITFPCLADSFFRLPFLSAFNPRGAWRYLRQVRLGRAFRKPSITAIGNHSLGASRTLHSALGISANRIVPWEWTKLSPNAPPRNLPAAHDQPIRILYAGTLSDEKGAGDLVEAAILLLGRGRRIHVTLFGMGPSHGTYVKRVKDAGFDSAIELPGPVGKSHVRELMQTCDIAVLPSRHSYPEGLPNTLVEGLAFRIPLVVTDHPALVGRVIDGVNCVVAKAGQPEDLARSFERYFDQPELYRRVSEQAKEAYDALFFGASWYEVVKRFLDDPRNSGGWVERHSLFALGGYEGGKQE